MLRRIIWWDRPGVSTSQVYGPRWMRSFKGETHGRGDARFSTPPLACDKVEKGSEWAGWSPAEVIFGGRKVRAPKDRAVGNAHRPQGQGKCNRKQTAPRGLGSVG